LSVCVIPSPAELVPTMHMFFIYHILPPHHNPAVNKHNESSHDKWRCI
jgi:hypothetical protein